MSYVYRETKRGSGVFEVGHYAPPFGRWKGESRHQNPNVAAWRVSYLNGGGLVNPVAAQAPKPADEAPPSQPAPQAPRRGRR